MNNNIFMVLSSDHVNDILEKYQNNIIVTLCASNKSNAKLYKKQLLADAISEPECIFVFIEVESFSSHQEIPLNQLPICMFFYKGNKLSSTCNYSETSTTGQIKYLKNIINVINQKNNDQNNNNQSNSNIAPNEDNCTNNHNDDKNTNKHINLNEENTNDDDKLKEKIQLTNKKYEELDRLEKLVELKKLKASLELTNDKVV